MRAKRRSLSAYLVEPFKQIRFGLHVVSLCMVFVTLLAYLYTMAFREQYEQVVDFFKVAESEDLVNNDVFMKNGYIIGATLILFVLSMMFLVVRRTHKMYGPMISIMRFVSELSRGNYGVRIHIRQKDDFQNLVTKLNELASILHSKYGNKPGEKMPELDSLDQRAKDSEEGVVQVTSPETKFEDAG
jgi:hypothetical protein